MYEIQINIPWIILTLIKREHPREFMMTIIISLILLILIMFIIVLPIVIYYNYLRKNELKIIIERYRLHNSTLGEYIDKRLQRESFVRKIVIESIYSFKPYIDDFINNVSKKAEQETSVFIKYRKYEYLVKRFQKRCQV